MDEGRKRVLLIAACIWVAPKFGDRNGGPMSPRQAGVIGDAVRIHSESPELTKSNWRDNLRGKDSRH
jgi:hypothetical protein